MNDAVIKKPIYKKWWFWLIVFIVLAAIGKSGNKDNAPSSAATAPAASAPASTSVAVQLPPMPAQEENFINAVSAAQKDAQNTENDMQKGGVKAKRDKEVCGIMSNKNVSGWVGTVQGASRVGV